MNILFLYSLKTYRKATLYCLTSKTIKRDIQAAAQKHLAGKKHIYYIDPYENHTDRTDRLHTEGIFQKFVSCGQLSTLEGILDGESNFFTEDQTIVLRQLIALH